MRRTAYRAGRDSEASDQVDDEGAVGKALPNRRAAQRAIQ